MRYFSGFCLKDDSSFFRSFTDTLGAYDICGFSYGAIKAFLYAQHQLQNHQRVDRVILLSPAFFQQMPEKLKKLQLRSFAKNKEQYVENFLKNCFSPYEERAVEVHMQTQEDLQELLYFQWRKEDIQVLLDQGVLVEVYLGGKDKIISSQEAFSFFSSVTNTTLIKDANHFLLLE